MDNFIYCMGYRESLRDTKEAILESLKWKLENNEQVYFSDEVSEAVDNEVSTYSRNDSLEMIDESGNEQYIDKGIIDNSDIDRMLLTTAYGCLEQEIYNDEELCEIGRQLEDNDYDKNDILMRIRDFF